MAEGKKRLFKRETCTLELNELLNRAEQVNHDPYYLYYVKELIVFGSYVNTQNPKIHDLDIALDLEQKCDDREFVMKKSSERVRASGKSLSFVDTIYYCYIETAKYLQNRSHILSLHDIDMYKKIKDDYGVHYGFDYDPVDIDTYKL